MRQTRVMALVICLVLILTLVPLTLACKSTPTQKPAPSTTAKPAPATSAPAATTSAPAPTPAAPKPTTTTPVTTATTAPAPTTTAPTTAPAKVINWKALSGYVGGSNDNLGYLEVIKRINERAKGQLVIQAIGGPEVYPTDQQFQPLKLGTVDMLITSPGYIADALPEAAALMYGFGATMTQFRTGGVIGKLDEWAKQGHGVTLLGTPYTAKFSIWSTKPIKVLGDLTHLKVRSHASYNPLLQPLGVPTVNVSISELYSALERGVVDAAVLGNYNLRVYGIEKIVKYRIDPPFWIAIGGALFANQKSFNALSPDLQKLVIDTVISVENDLPTIFGPVNNTENAALKAAGIQPIRLSDEDWFTAQKIAWSSGLPSVLKTVSPVHYQEVMSLLGQFYPPKAPFTPVDQ